ncbi:MAG: M67 family metallopeptidase [Bacteroidetes bacterium]|nr:M67 family metallopeptidase [Bacteroidota bacterium]MCL6103872.1 M67 family metallopeptidase [Bacteroidota bacterium]
MISIKQSIIDQIVAHARHELPNEACGYLAGDDGVVTHSYQLTNIDHSPEHFSFDPAEQFQTVRDARNKGLQIVANYHSHPATPARPSVEDIRLAYDPGISYLIISLASNQSDVKSFRIKDSIVEKEEIIIV